MWICWLMCCTYITDESQRKTENTTKTNSCFSYGQSFSLSTCVQCNCCNIFTIPQNFPEEFRFNLNEMEYIRIYFRASSLFFFYSCYLVRFIDAADVEKRRKKWYILYLYCTYEWQFQSEREWNGSNLKQLINQKKERKEEARNTKREIRKQPHAEHKPWQSQVLVVQPPNRMNQREEKKNLLTQKSNCTIVMSVLMLEDAIAPVTLAWFRVVAVSSAA